MRIKISFLATMFLIASFVVGAAIASEDVRSKQVRVDMQPSDEMTEGTNALRGLVLALASGKDAMRPLRGPRSENHAEKDRLNAPIAGLECYIDRIASYVSCYSPVIDPEEAETLVTRLLDELQAALPSHRWKESTKQPGTSLIRSYSYEDRQSNAHINIDIIDRLGVKGQNSYMVSMFGWTH